jgi:5'-3' exonuclease
MNLEYPWILVDTSYVIYYTVHGAWNWYKREFTPTVNKEEPLDISNDNEYLSMVKHALKHNIVKVLTNHTGLFDKSKIIFCLDCPRKNIWRRSYYDLYKMNRDTSKQKHEFNVGPVFSHARDMLIPNLAEEFGGHRLQCDAAEGDDVVAVATAKLSQNGKVLILTCDYDMAQLINPNVSIINLQNEEISLAKITEKYGVETIDDYLKLKIFMGDAGDNIPAIHEKCGKVKALKYVKDSKALMENAKIDLDSVKANLKRNKLLIDFKMIPKEIKEAVENKLAQLLH